MADSRHGIPLELPSSVAVSSDSAQIRDLRLRAGRNKFYRVAQQVGNALREGGFISHHYGQGPFHLDLNLRGLKSGIGMQYPVQDFVHVDWFEFKLGSCYPAKC